ncbi:nuclear transport factor 2 family protein [Streptomyces boncukensis]|uniref:Nuclear transport factor 2 family protein n=1 Tax=Streptomyces boncukensis TaxID=2711219 RepID=A0A6G4WQH0_9ACTN|nr:nuclear transport factor 2 family protein [Streptomyces boncukensis]NGO66877.1 nuclear transport factor 2 family protein [Streptomyces boncukensis]
MTSTGAPEEHFAIQDVVSRFGRMVDDRNWDRLPGIFTEQVRLDYTELFGGRPQEVPGGTIGDRWRARLSGFSATQHVITNVVADVGGATADVVANVVATHVLRGPADSRMVTCGGTYQLGMARGPGRWLISAVTARLVWTDGDLGLFAAAAEHAPKRRE